MSRRPARFFRSIRKPRRGETTPAADPATRSALPRLGWMAVGALMASTAIGGRSTAAYAAGPPPGGRAAWVGAQSAQPPDSGAVKTFDIPAGPLASVLDAFEKATGMTVVIDTARLQGAN